MMSWYFFKALDKFYLSSERISVDETGNELVPSFIDLE